MRGAREVRRGLLIFHRTGCHRTATLPTQKPANSQHRKFKMKPQHSATITLPKDQPSKTGTPLGAHGLPIRGASGQSAPTLPARSFVQSLEPQARFKHRAFIAFRVEALLDGYWQSRPDEAVKDMILSDWMEALEDFAPEEIDAACKAYLRSEARARKPKTGDIVDLMVSARTARRKALERPAPPPPSPVLTVAQEDRRRQAAAIMASFMGVNNGQV